MAVKTEPGLQALAAPSKIRIHPRYKPQGQRRGRWFCKKKFDDRLEVTSPGMLDNELTIEKMKSGLPKIRNKGIAAAFSYMNVIEAWGSGIPKIFREAKEYGLPEPELIDMGSDSRINLYRKDAAVDANGVIDPKEAANHSSGTVGTDGTNSGTDGTNGTILSGLTDEEATIVKLIQAEPTVTQK